MAGAPVLETLLPSSASASTPPSRGDTTAAAVVSSSSSAVLPSSSGNEAYIRRLHDEVMRNAPEDLTGAVRYAWRVVHREWRKEEEVDFDREPEVKVYGSGQERDLELEVGGWTVGGEEDEDGEEKGEGELEVSSGPLAAGKTLLD